MFKMKLVILTATFALTGCDFEIPGSVSKTGKTEKFVLADKFYTAEEFGKTLKGIKAPSNPPRRAEFDLGTVYYQVKVQGSPVRCKAATTESCKTAIVDYQKTMQRQSGMGY